MDTNQEAKPKQSEGSNFMNLPRILQPLPESLKNIKMNSNFFQGISGNKCSSNKKKNQTKINPKAVLVTLPPDLTPQSKNSMWANINLYYVEGQEKKSFPNDFPPPPKFIQSKSNTTSKEIRTRPSTVVQTSKTKRSLSFSTSSAMPRHSNTKTLMTPYNTKRKSSRLSSTLKKPLPTIKISVPKDQEDSSILNDFEQLKNLKIHMIELLGTIQKKIDSNKENTIQLKSDCIDALQNMKNNDSLKAFELEEQLLSKKPKKIYLDKCDINDEILKFNNNLSALFDHFEISLFDYLNETIPRANATENKDNVEVCTDKIERKGKFLSSTSKASISQKQRGISIKSPFSIPTLTPEVFPITSEDNTISSINRNQLPQKSLPSTPKTNKTPLKYNQKILNQYRELKFGVGNVLATPIVNGSEMRLNRQHNLKISQNVLKQLNSLELD